MYFGTTRARWVAMSRHCDNASNVGCFANAAKPITRREKWSSTMAIHHVKGATGGTAKGDQVVVVPSVAIVVRSTFQTWFGRFAVTVRADVARSPFPGGSGGSTFVSRLINRRTVETPRWRPA